MRFKPGQEVVCVVRKWSKRKTYLWGYVTTWVDINYGPRYNEVVTVAGDAGTPYIFIEEYQGPAPGLNGIPAFNEKDFEPLISDEELESALKEMEHA